MLTFDPVYLSISERAPAILGVMDSLRSRQNDYVARIGRWKRAPLLLFLAGFPFLLLDVMLGYNCLTFSLVAFGLWGAALFVRRALKRAASAGQFAPHYQTAREVIDTLRDDLAPRANFFGHVDLTGAQQPDKLFRKAPNQNGHEVSYYRDEWLNLKAKLYDGNMVRLSAVARFKVREGFWKTSHISRKRKWKEPRMSNAQALTIRLSVNPDVYDITPQPKVAVGAAVGPYTIEAVETGGGIIRISAMAVATTISSNDILAMLRLTYTLLRRKGAA